MSEKLGRRLAVGQAMDGLRRTFWEVGKMGKGNRRSILGSLPGFDVGAAEREERAIDSPTVDDRRIPGGVRGRMVCIDFLNLSQDDPRIRTPEQLRG